MFDNVDNTNWRAVIDTLLGTLGLSYEIEIVEDKIVIRTNDEDAASIQAKLQEVLQTPQAFFEALPYSISRSTTDDRKIAIRSTKSITI